MLKVGKDYRFNKGIARFYIEQRWIDFVIPNYNLEKVIGVGANGVVFLAHEEFTDRNVVIKAWIPKSKDIKRYRDQFLAEIRKIGKISHPNIATIYGADIYKNKICWAVYNYIEGISLKDWLADNPSEIYRLDVAKSIFETVIFYQKKGILHGDLHDGNIMIDEGNKVHIIDFGTSEFSSSKKTRRREIGLMLILVEKLLCTFKFYAKDHFLLEPVFTKNGVSYKTKGLVEKYLGIAPCCLSVTIVNYINILDMLTNCNNYNYKDFVDYCVWLANSSYLNIKKLIDLYIEQDEGSAFSKNIFSVVQENIGEDIFPENGLDVEQRDYVYYASREATKELKKLLNIKKKQVEEFYRNNIIFKYIISTRIRELLCEEENYNWQKELNR
jgi:serine/threonine protein kinase